MTLIKKSHAYVIHTSYIDKTDFTTQQHRHAYIIHTK